LLNIKNNYLQAIKRKVDQKHFEKLPMIKVRLNKNRRVSIMSTELNSTAMLIFVFIRILGLLFTNVKKNIHNKWLLIFYHVFFLCIFNVNTTKTKSILSIVR